MQHRTAARGWLWCKTARLSRSHISFVFLMIRRPPRSTLFPLHDALPISAVQEGRRIAPARRSARLGAPVAFITPDPRRAANTLDRKSTRLNSSHANISYAVFCLKKKKHNPPRSNTIPQPTRDALRQNYV